MYTLADALNKWEAAGKYGTRQERLARGKLWLPYYSYLAEKKLGTTYLPGEQPEKVVNFLLRENVLKKEDHVLDIGAGMGSYSIELARHCAQVTALDMNEDALQVLSLWSRQQNLTNIRLCCAAWEEFAPKSKFDVSFSSMCPAVCSQDEILRLEQMTRRTCCLLTVSRGSYERCRMEMMKGLPRKNIEGMVTEAIHYINVLYLMGRQPDMKCWSQEFTTTARMSDLIEQYRIYFRIFGVDDTVSVPYMEDFLAKHEHNGVISDTCKMNYALICWDVPAAA